MKDCFNIVWADDEVKSLYENNEMLFKRFNINVKCFTYSSSAIEYIRKNAALVDGIITDAKYGRTPMSSFKDKSRDFPGLSQFIKELYSLRKESGKELPAWIFTGYGNLLREKYSAEDLDCFQPEIIDKNYSYDQLCKWMEEMTSHIRESNDRDFTIRQENAEFFEMCDDELLDKRLERKLFDIFRFDSRQPNSPFNEIRIIAEEVMTVLHKKGIHQFYADVHSLGKRLEELRTHKETLEIEDYVINSLSLIVNMTNPESHSSEEAKMQSVGLMPFAYGMTVDALKTVLYWLKDFVSKPRRQTESFAHPQPIDESSRITQKTKKYTSHPVAKNQTEPSPQPKHETPVDDVVPNEDKGRIVEGNLGVKAYTLNVDGAYPIIPRDIVQRNHWIPGKTRLRARIGNVDGKLTVLEVLGKIN